MPCTTCQPAWSLVFKWRLEAVKAIARSNRSRRSSSVGNAASNTSGGALARLQPERTNPNSTIYGKQADNVAIRMANTLEGRMADEAGGRDQTAACGKTIGGLPTRTFAQDT